MHNIFAPLVRNFAGPMESYLLKRTGANTWVSYETALEANTLIPPAVRHIGMLVVVGGELYHYKTAILNINLVPVDTTGGGGGGGSTTPLTGTINAPGGTITCPPGLYRELIIMGDGVVSASSVPLVPGLKPSATVTVLSVPLDNFNIKLTTSVAMGSVEICTYFKAPTDTSVEILAASIAASITEPGYVATVLNEVITIEHQTLGSLFNGELLVISHLPTATVDGQCVIDMTPFLSFPDDTLVTIKTQLVDGTIVTLGSYTKLVTDTASTLAAAFTTAITGNPYGYTVLDNDPEIVLTAPDGLGASINGRVVSFLPAGVVDSDAFSGGVNALGIIEVESTAFAGGDDTVEGSGVEPYADELTVIEDEPATIHIFKKFLVEKPIYVITDNTINYELYFH